VKQSITNVNDDASDALIYENSQVVTTPL